MRVEKDEPANNDEGQPEITPPKMRYYQIREGAIWGDDSLATSNLPNVKIDGFLQMAGDWQAMGGCCPWLLTGWGSFVAKLARWTDQDIQQSLDLGREQAKLRQRLGIQEKGMINIHVEIKLPFRRKQPPQGH